MTGAAGSAPITGQTLDAVLRQDRGRLLAALIARLRDFQLAEDALHEALESALVHWGRSGLPASPQGWLLKVAQRKALDRLRASARDGQRRAALLVLATEEASDMAVEDIPDERLRLIFTCCHPALEPKTRVALTLRTIAGLSSAEIAHAFLDAEPAMIQRLSRARIKLREAGIPFAVPGPEDWPLRLQSVLAVIYLIFNAGYTAGPEEPRDLCEEAIFLARLLAHLHPAEAEVEGCLALMLLTHARKAARSPDGVTIPLAVQDRSLWDASAIAEGLALVATALARRSPGPYQIKAAIAACHVQGPTPDWPQIAALYAGLQAHEPTPVVRLNHAVAVAEGQGAETGLAMMEALGTDLEGYQPLHAARAEYLFRLGRWAEARAAYDRAIALAPSAADGAFLTRRRARLPDTAPD